MKIREIRENPENPESLDNEWLEEIDREEENKKIKLIENAIRKKHEKYERLGIEIEEDTILLEVQKELNLSLFELLKFKAEMLKRRNTENDLRKSTQISGRKGEIPSQSTFRQGEIVEIKEVSTTENTQKKVNSTQIQEPETPNRDEDEDENNKKNGLKTNEKKSSEKTTVSPAKVELMNRKRQNIKKIEALKNNINLMFSDRSKDNTIQILEAQIELQQLKLDVEMINESELKLDFADFRKEKFEQKRDGEISGDDYRKSVKDLQDIEKMSDLSFNYKACAAELKELKLKQKLLEVKFKKGLISETEYQEESSKIDLEAAKSNLETAGEAIQDENAERAGNNLGIQRLDLLRQREMGKITNSDYNLQMEHLQQIRSQYSNKPLSVEEIRAAFLKMKEEHEISSQDSNPMKKILEIFNSRGLNTSDLHDCFKDLKNDREASLPTKENNIEGVEDVR